MCCCAGSRDSPRRPDALVAHAAKEAAKNAGDKISKAGDRVKDAGDKITDDA